MIRLLRPAVFASSLAGLAALASLSASSQPRQEGGAAGPCLCSFNTSLIDLYHWDEAPCAESIWYTSENKENGKCAVEGTSCSVARRCSGTFTIGATSAEGQQCHWKIEAVAFLNEGIWFEDDEDPELIKNIIGDCDSFGVLHISAGSVDLAHLLFACVRCSATPPQQH